MAGRSTGQRSNLVYNRFVTNLEALVISQRIQLRILTATQAIDRLTLEDKDMAVSDQVAQIISQFDVATDAIASRIQRLINSSGTLSADDKAAFQAEVDKLTALGKDPENPTPAA